MTIDYASGQAGSSAATEVAALKAHPAFDEAARRSAEYSVELYGSSRLVGWLLGDRARALFGFVITYLHAARDPGDARSGVTSTRVKEFCAARALCSPGRAGAMLALMQAGGYLTTASGTEDRRVRRLEPTPRLFALQRERLRAQYEAALAVMPEASLVMDNLHRPDFQDALARGIADHFISGFRILDHAPGLALFAERSAGVVILYSLMLAPAAPGAFPPRGAVDLAIAPLARRFGVSRVHILRLLRDAETRGLIERVGPEGSAIRFAPQLVEAVRDFAAAMFVLLGQGARRALAESARPGPAPISGPSRAGRA